MTLVSPVPAMPAGSTRFVVASPGSAVTGWHGTCFLLNGGLT
jgi:hypothetical protein